MFTDADGIHLPVGVDQRVWTCSYPHVDVLYHGFNQMPVMPWHDDSYPHHVETAQEQDLHNQFFRTHTRIHRI